MFRSLKQATLAVFLGAMVVSGAQAAERFLYPTESKKSTLQTAIFRISGFGSFICGLGLIGHLKYCITNRTWVAIGLKKDLLPTLIFTSAAVLSARL